MKNNKFKLVQIFAFGCVLFAAAHETQAQTQPNPTQTETNEWRTKGPCRDPWVSKAVSQANSSVRPAHGYGDFGECDTAQYNGGAWNSYDELYKAVEKARSDMSSSSFYWESYTNRNGRAVFLLDSSANPISAGLIQDGGAYLLGTDSGGIRAIIGRMVAAGGGNMVAAGGGNFMRKLQAAKLVGNDGASMVAAGGGNLISNVAMSNFAGALAIEKINPNVRVLQQVGNAKKYFKVGSSYYVIR